ncbi:hypothetical protein BGZ94_000244, partial [Podila epigama]
IDTASLSRRRRNIFMLPEICDLIAAHLSQHSLAMAVQVSSQWYSTFIRHLWMTVSLSSCNTPTSLSILSTLPTLGHHIRTLYFSNLSPTTTTTTTTDADTSTSTSTDDNEDSSSWTLKSALQEIDLSSLALAHLYLAKCPTLHASVVERLVASSAHKLATLRMHRIERIQGDLLRIAAGLPQLRQLSLTVENEDGPGHRHGRPSHPVTPAELVVPAATSPTHQLQQQQLQQLQQHLQQSIFTSEPTGDMDEQDKEADDVVSAVGFEITSADSIPALLDACPKLQTIELVGLASAALTSSLSLETVASDSDSNTTVDTHTSALFKANLQQMQYLTAINLHSTTLSGTTLSAIFNRCQHLTSLDLNQSSPLFLTGLMLNEDTVLTKLTTLHLSGCRFLDGHGFKEIFRASPNVMTLELSDTNVDNEGMAALGRYCRFIIDLCLNNCHQITDQGIRDYLGHSPLEEQQQHGYHSGYHSGHHHHHHHHHPNHQQDLPPYQNYTLQCLSMFNCTELTGQGIRHILATCAALKSLAFQQPEIMPQSMFPHELHADEEDEEVANATEETSTTASGQVQGQEDSHHQEGQSTDSVELESTTTTANIPESASIPWACQGTLEMLRIKNLDVINKTQMQYLNARLRELSQLKVLHIGGSQLELSVLNGLGHRLENLYISDLAREVDVNDVRWLVDHTPNLTRLWCRQLIRHSEPWKMLRGARKHLKLW